jgi:hypothetical protein
VNGKHGRGGVLGARRKATEKPPTRLVRLIVWADRDFAFKISAHRRWERSLLTSPTRCIALDKFLQDDAGDEVVRAIRERWASPPRIVHNQTITLLSMDWDATDAQTGTVLTTSNQY